MEKRRGAKPEDSVHPIDRHVGERVRMARASRGLSQTALATAGGVSFQQVQKYEKGTNRIGASRLFEFAEFLGVDISYFFVGAVSEGNGVPKKRRSQRWPKSA